MDYKFDLKENEITDDDLKIFHRAVMDELKTKLTNYENDIEKYNVNIDNLTQQRKQLEEQLTN